MIGKLWTMLQDGLESLVHSGIALGESTDIQHYRLALAVVLLDVAFVDNEFDNREYSTIVAGLEKLLGENHAQVEKLVQEARELRVREDIDLDTIAGHLGQHLSEADRKGIFRLIRDIVMADFEVHSFEKALRRRYEKLLFPKKSKEE